MAHGFRESAKLRDYGRDKRAFYKEGRKKTNSCVFDEREEGRV